MPRLKVASVSWELASVSRELEDSPAAAKSVTLPAWHQPLPSRNELAEPDVGVGIGGRLEELQLEGVKLGGPATQVGSRRTSET